MLNKKLICIIAVFAFYSTNYNVNCSSRITVFSGSVEEFSK